MFSIVSRGLKWCHWYRLNQSHVSAQRDFHNWILIATLMWCLNMLLSMARMFVCLNPLSVLWAGNVPEQLTNSLKDLVKWFSCAKGSWRFWTHPTSLHPQWLSSPQISGHNETKSHKTCQIHFLVFYPLTSELTRKRWRRTQNREFKMHSGVWTQWMQTQLGVKQVRFMLKCGI